MFHLSQEERCKHHNIKDLKLAFSEFYLSLILLQNYQVSAHTIMHSRTHDEMFCSINECVLYVSCISLFGINKPSNLFVWHGYVLTVVPLLLSVEPELHWFP